MHRILRNTRSGFIFFFSEFWGASVCRLNNLVTTEHRNRAVSSYQLDSALCQLVHGLQSFSWTNLYKPQLTGEAVGYLSPCPIIHRTRTEKTIVTKKKTLFPSNTNLNGKIPAQSAHSSTDKTCASNRLALIKKQVLRNQNWKRHFAGLRPAVLPKRLHCKISGFRRGVNEVCALWGFYAE